MSTSLTLRKRIINAASWTMGGHVFSQFLRLASNLIMTRLLVPEMFGVMAIANVVMIGLAMMSDVGIRQHIIQSSRSDSEDFINTAWVVQIIRGGILCAFGLFISWSFILLADSSLWSSSSVYADPILPYVIGILSFTAVISGLESTNLAMANRNLVMNKVVKIELISQFTGIILMVTWAYIDRTIWALVVGAIVSSLVKTALSYTMLPGNKNRICWKKKSLHELLHFGKWIFLTSILGFLVINGDRLILGGLIDAKLLGIYTIALFIASAVQNILGKIIGSIALPALSEVVRNRPEDLKKVYYKFRFPVDVITFFLAGVLFISGGVIIDLLYDVRYSAAGFMLEILSIALIMERYSLTNQCYIAMGKPSLMIPVISTRMFFLYVGLPVMYYIYGLNAAIWSIVAATYATLPVTLYYKIKNGLLDIYKEVFTIPFFFLGIVAGYGVKYIYLIITSV